MDPKKYEREIRLLYIIAKANGDVDTGLRLLLMILDFPEQKPLSIPSGLEKHFEKSS